MLSRYSLNITEISRLPLVFYAADGSIRWFNNCSILDMTVFMAVQYTIIIYCAVVMYQQMEEKLQILSASLRNLHRQFYKTLVVQIITPSVFLFAPVAIIINIPMFDLEISVPTGAFVCGFTLYPAMDAIIVMYIVKDYRKAVRIMLKKLLDMLYRVLDLNDYRLNVSTTATAGKEGGANNGIV
ncbi:hypothetical protein GCK72_016828 [Caenorhabditis remanei]|uniref:Seven TM Receptor n=1 Tax=Caenorhabditis remanei TaxID=31234 RepID=A0A6A5G6E6_CAERE|nr:hypothetical protein GCK72_016828 [Caenorhabditis remanei]KAF1750281.1 hypothetical protein GCK72_016828 [Caenorhabditis remanei]